MRWFNRGDCKPLISLDPARVSAELSGDFGGENIKKPSEAGAA